MIIMQIALLSHAINGTISHLFTIEGRMKRTTNDAFTLVELSIVLVIIGLLVGGVMVGQDLIKGGSFKKQVSQVENYRVGTNAFRDKYRGIPGDLIAQTANGFTMTARSGGAGHGDGNGRIEGCSANATVAGCETLLYWNDLTFAGMLSPSMTTATDTLATITSSNRDDYLPRAALNQNHITVYTDGNSNYYQIAGVTATSAGGDYTLANAMTPMDALSIDTKLDDGMPLVGSVRAVGGVGPLGVAAFPGAANCVAATADNPYNTTTDATGSANLCQLSLRF